MTVTEAFEWVEKRLDEGAWFRRGYVVAATVLMWETTKWAMAYANANVGRDAIAVAGVIAAVSAIPAGVMAHAFQIYITSRS